MMQKVWESFLFDLSFALTLRTFSYGQYNIRPFITKNFKSLFHIFHSVSFFLFIFNNEKNINLAFGTRVGIKLLNIAYTFGKRITVNIYVIWYALDAWINPPLHIVCAIHTCLPKRLDSIMVTSWRHHMHFLSLA